MRRERESFLLSLFILGFLELWKGRGSMFFDEFGPLRFEDIDLITGKTLSKFFCLVMFKDPCVGGDRSMIFGIERSVKNVFLCFVQSLGIRIYGGSPP